MVFESLLVTYKAPNKSVKFTKSEFLRVYGEIMYRSYLNYMEKNFLEENPFMVIHFKKRDKISSKNNSKEGEFIQATKTIKVCKIKKTRIKKRVLTKGEISKIHPKYSYKDITKRIGNGESTDPNELKYVIEDGDTTLYEVIGTQMEPIEAPENIYPSIPIHVIMSFTDQGTQTNDVLIKESIISHDIMVGEDHPAEVKIDEKLSVEKPTTVDIGTDYDPLLQSHTMDESLATSEPIKVIRMLQEHILEKRDMVMSATKYLKERGLLYDVKKREILKEACPFDKIDINGMIRYSSAKRSFKEDLL
jgi:hypothetical protein